MGALYYSIYIENPTRMLVYMYKCDKYQNVMYCPICMQLYNSKFTQEVCLQKDI